MAIVFCFLMSSHIYKMNFLYLYYSIFLISFHTPVLFFWYLFICLYRFRYSYTFLFFGYFSSFHDVFFFIPILFCHFLLSSFENAFFINKHYSFFLCVSSCILKMLLFSLYYCVFLMPFHILEIVTVLNCFIIPLFPCILISFYLCFSDIFP